MPPEAVVVMGSEPAAGDRSELEAARRLLQDAFATGDVEALGSILTDDVVWKAAGRPPWVGRTAVLDQLGHFFDRFAYDFRLERTRFDGDDSRALERSNFISRVAGEDSSPLRAHRGAVVILWLRQDRWMLSTYLDIGAPLFD